SVEAAACVCPSIPCTGELSGGRGGGLSGLGWRGGLAQVALGVDSPALGQLGEIVVDRPAVGARLALVVRGGALKQHRAGVVADRAYLGHLVARERVLRRQRGQLGALVLDRSRA